MARTFNLSSLRLEGETAVLARTVGQTSYIGSATFSTSGNGIVVYGAAAEPGKQMTWFSPEGQILGLAGPAGDYQHPRLSPDGRRVALSRRISENLDIWLYEFSRDLMARLTFDPLGDANPVWSPDGAHVAFNASRAAGRGLFRIAASGTGQQEALAPAFHVKLANDWSSDGRHLLYAEVHPETQFDLWVLPFEGERKPVPVVRTPFSEWNGQFSPDGKWIAYTSDENGRPEVYVQAFPPSGQKWQISNSGGHRPRWRRDGKELFFVSGAALMAAPVRTTANGLEAETPRELFRAQASEFDVTADGRRFLVLAPVEHSAQTLTVITGWQTTPSPGPLPL